jgi:hypothetical protein
MLSDDDGGDGGLRNTNKKDFNLRKEVKIQRRIVY